MRGSLAPTLGADKSLLVRNIFPNPLRALCIYAVLLGKLKQRSKYTQLEAEHIFTLITILPIDKEGNYKWSS